jgi:hypothetical protein
MYLCVVLCCIILRWMMPCLVWQDYLRKLWRGYTTMRMVMTGLYMGRVEFQVDNQLLRGLVELVSPSHQQRP